MSEEITETPVPVATPKKRGKRGQRMSELLPQTRKRLEGNAQGRLARILELRYVRNLSYEDIAKLVGYKHRSDVEEVCRPYAMILGNPELIKQFKHYEADINDGIRWLLVQGMHEQLTDPERRKKMDFSRLSWGYATLYDKMRLERGESTTNVMTLSELVKQAHAKDVTPAEAEIVKELPKESQPE